MRFQWKSTGQEDIGLIAEEVEKALPDLVIHENGQPESVKYAQLPVYLVAVAKQQRAEIESLRTENQELGRRLAALESMVRQNAEKQPQRK